MRHAMVVLGVCVASAAINVETAAQSTGRFVPCQGQRIDSITVDAQAPTVAGLRRVPVIGNVVRETHVVTRDDVVRRFLLIEVGEPCSELRRAESERILRAQTFIADATIEVIANAKGGVNLDVRTIDEASLILTGAVAGASPAIRAVKVGSANLAGMGVATSLAWGYQPGLLDDRLEVRASDYQFLGQPWVLSLGLARDPLGRDDRAELSFPFRTDLQRYAWRTRLGKSEGTAQFVKRDTGRLTLGYTEEYAEVGAIGRLGPPGKLSLVGLSITSERAWPDSAPLRLVQRAGFRPDTATEFAGRFVETRAARLNALLGVRGIRFMRARAFDALRATQDVPIGLQFGTLVGRGVRAFGSDSRDLFVASDLYMGWGTPTAAYRLQLQGEGVRPESGQPFNGLVASGRLARYSRPTNTRTRIISLEWSGTSKVLIPHALTLGIPDGGIRGFNNSSEVGGRRGIARVDERYFLGSPYSFGDFGLAWFADAGKLWAGDVPYGTTTRMRGSLGLSALFAVPMRSTRTWRLDFAVPIHREPGAATWQVRLSNTDRTTFFWREPADVDAARARAVPASIYSWP